MKKRTHVRGMRRWIAAAGLLGAACAHDSPLAPRPAPEPALDRADTAPAPEAAGRRTVVRLGEGGGVKRPSLWLVDGRAVPADSIRRLDPGTIASIEVIRGAAAVALHGPAASHGVVIITTRAPR